MVFNEYYTPSAVKNWCGLQNPTINVGELFSRAQFKWTDFAGDNFEKRLTKYEAARLNVALYAVGYKTA